MDVRFADDAAIEEFERLPRSIKIRVDAIFRRLAHWPAVSGAKALRGDLAGRYRIRTGDYRIQFFIRDNAVVIEKIGHRDGFYED